MNRLYIFAFIFLSFSSHAEIIETSLDQKTRIPLERNLRYKMTTGHNISSNPYLLDSGECTMGSYSAVCGVNPYLTMGTISWLWWGYNSSNFVARTAYALNSKQTIGAQFFYLKSFNEGTYHGYQMESLRSQAIFSQKISKLLTIHTNLTYEYFMEETFAHSYRRNPLNDNPYQVSLTSLFEFDLSEEYVFQAEIGGHGLNYVYPQLLMSYSFGRRFKNAYIQLGVSMTGYPIAYFASDRRDTQKEYYVNNKGEGFEGEDNSVLMQRDFSVHPEVQVQYFF